MKKIVIVADPVAKVSLVKFEHVPPRAQEEPARDLKAGGHLGRPQVVEEHPRGRVGLLHRADQAVTVSHVL